MHARVGEIPHIHLRKLPPLRAKDVHPAVSMPGLGHRIGRIGVVEILILAGQETVVAVMAFGDIYDQVPFLHFFSSLYLSISTRHELGAIPQAFFEM